MPEPFSTISGAEIRSRCISRPNSFWNVSRMNLMASSVSRTDSLGS